MQAAKKLHVAGFPFGAATAETSDAMDWLGTLLLSFGFRLMYRDGNITIESDGTLAGLEFLIELTQYMPKEIAGGDDAFNKRWIISGF